MSRFTSSTPSSAPGGGSGKRPASGPQATEEPPIVQEFDDGRSFDPVAVHQSTQRWIATHMKKREEQFTESAPIKLFCGTWNVNGKVLKDGGLSDWLFPANSEYVDEAGQPVADLYAIGFQEAVDLTAVNVAMETETKKRAVAWQEAIAECLNGRGVGYRLVATKYLVGLLLYCYVKESVADKVKDVRSASVGVGVMGMLGNKGGVSIRLTLFDSGLCFVCSHLAAHRENVAGRNADYKNILEKTVFIASSLSENAPPGQGADSLEVEKRQGSQKSKSFRYKTGLSELDEYSIFDNDVVFWVGDLNYRIDEAVSMDEVFTRIENDDLGILRDNDQLNMERARGNAFQEFSEGQLLFPPTYKYQPGFDTYDRRPEKKVRAPAWCDRILWRLAKGGSESLAQLSYRRSELKPSDHKPVCSLFACNLRRIIADKERAVFEHLLRELDKWENDSIPKVDFSTKVVDFGVVHYMEKYSTSVKIRNSGTAIAHWHFVPKLEDKKVSKRFVKFSPVLGMLLPGEEVKVSVDAMVDVVTARALNKGSEVLDDIVVLRIENGSDFYLEVKAQYARSCYGMSLEELVCTWDPVRSTLLPSEDRESGREQIHVPRDESVSQAAEEAAAAGTGAPAPGPGKEMSIPKEVWRIVDALWTNGGVTENDIFVVGADPSEVSAVRECLDRGEDFPSQISPHALVEALTSFLLALPTPLIPHELYPSQIDIEPQNIRAWARRFLEQLPPLNYNLFVYLLSFERELLKFESDNKLTAQRMAALSVGFMTRLGSVVLPPTSATDAPNAAPDETYAGATAEVSAAGSADSKASIAQNTLQSAIMYFLTSQSL
jgi:phosphatidylinositol-bisphosphatase